jgi:hypothetical protein
VYRSEEQLPTQYVNNEVLWKNRNMDLPFPLYENEPTDLGLFLVSPAAHRNEGLKMGVDAMHGRSAMLIQAYVTDAVFWSGMENVRLDLLSV